MPLQFLISSVAKKIHPCMPCWCISAAPASAMEAPPRERVGRAVGLALEKGIYFEFRALHLCT